MIEDLQIRFTNQHEEASRYRDQGWEPIECAFGGYGSVLGPLCMDHHGAESWRPGVAIRACGDAYGARERDPRFVVTGTPDADAILAIVALGALIPKEAIPNGFPELVDLHDRNPIGLSLENANHGFLLLAFNQTTLPQGQAGFERGVHRMVELLTVGLPKEAIRHVLGTERSRLERAHRSLRSVFLPDGREISPSAPGTHPANAAIAEPRVALVKSAVWGFDVWYLYAPVVVSYSERLQKITVGCPDDNTAERMFGPGGLQTVWRQLGPGWGGREAVGGSPRGVALSWDDATRTASTLAGLLRTR